ncbi:DinB family protein [Paenibacillus ihbetae]|uniref:DinB-like domain-containing protein n=1 Tax=Paenibacillus ihbetae TaxID=1870820 RepID=A0ABX3JWX0_9BACL|nr:DinB family protein [Paenibacillus ihbetae]OOC62154.1 hypothetical protein BBD40_09975 [Paenibacillus ihbetae]
MREKEQLLGQYGEWIDRVKELAERDETLWSTPVAEGKWTVREVVCHIFRWDEYFFTEAIEKIARGEDPTSEHLDYDEFNENARHYAKACTTEALVRQTIAARERLIEAIRVMPENVYEGEYTDKDGHPFKVAQFMKDFIWHDNHHLRQLELVALM